MKINRFAGEYSWLSNFHPVEIIYEGIAYSSSEHAYQASKTLDPLEKRLVRNTTSPGQAKRFGRKVTIRKDWESIKVEVMRQICRIKFQNPELRQKLLDTGDAELIEGNTWHDSFWGVTASGGKNHLGKILMEIREELRG